MVRALQVIAILLASLVLIATVGLLAVECSWTTPALTSPLEHFLHGTTGTELMPLPVFLVLPDLFPEQFQPAGASAGDWVDQYGFVRADAESGAGLPYGISVVRARPKSGAPSPVPFVGFNCAVCHVMRLREKETDPGTLVYGMGNYAIDLVAFGNAMQSSLLDERLTMDAITSAYRSNTGQALGFGERLMIDVWLRGARRALAESVALRGQPYAGAELRDATLLPSGPGRNQPMKETVRFLINETPFPDGGSSKIPSLFEQQHRHWAQFDGSVKDPILRNSLAALGVGASLVNLRTSRAFGTLKGAAEYVRALPGPRYAEVFPAHVVDGARAGRGKDVYRAYCGDCHGWPGSAPNAWERGRRLGEVVPYQELGTDAERVTFRYYPRMAQLLYDFFPAGHPLKPARGDLRPNAGDPLGYIAAPLDSLFARAPYLHNGSVATLAELINLKPRRALLWRGSNLYDPVDVGLLVPEAADARRYFRYDTTAYGNSNRGHDYPWRADSVERDEERLRDLLEYLKTL